MAMSGLERKAALVLKKRKMAQLARELGVTQGHVGQVVSGERRSPMVEAAVAKALGRPHCEVFPPLPTPRKKRRVA